jgi:hypothetical protein
VFVCVCGVFKYLSVSRDSLESVERVLAHLAHLFDGDLLNTTLKNRLEDGVELSSGTGVIDELAHVSNDKGRAALDDDSPLSHATGQDGHKETEGGEVDVVDEGCADEGIKGILCELDGVHVASNDARDDGDDVDVGDGGADLSEGNAALLLDLLLDIRGNTNKLEDHLGEVALDDDGVVRAEGTEEDEAALLGLPLHGLEGLV